ncbi:MAG: hypothetical protein ACM3RX_01855 [Methanococcaceae archaeon]
MKKHLLFFCLVLLFSSCNKVDNEDRLVDNEDRLEGYFARDPGIHFYRYYLMTAQGITFPQMRMIDTLHSNDTLAFIVSEYNRADGKPFPAKGSDLYFEIETLSGDREKFYLDDYAGWFIHTDDHTPYFKSLTYSLYNSQKFIPVKNNQRIEINKGGDKVIATYSSYWHGHVVKDTLSISSML